MAELPDGEFDAREIEPYKESPMSVLSDRMQAFVEEYCTGAVSGRKFNKSRAAEVAGYTSAFQQTGVRLYGRADVKAAIDWRLGQLTMSNTELTERLNQIAETDLGDIIEVNELTGAVQYNAKALTRLKHMIKGASYDSNGNLKIEFHDPVQAMNMLARAKGLFVDRTELTGAGGGPVAVAMQIQFVRPPIQTENLFPENPVQDADYTVEDD